jgi:hypothetical protein
MRLLAKYKINAFFLPFVLAPFVLACLLTPVAAFGEGAPQAAVKEKIFNFGTVSQGAIVTHDFVIKNTGTADLVIQRIIPACGCTAAQASPDPIKPGAEGKVQVKFDTAGFSGEKFKTVRVNTNDVSNLSLVLSLKGTVQPDVMVDPQSVFFENVVRGVQGNSSTKTVTISVREGASTTITGIKSFSPSIQVREKESSPRRRVLEVSIDPSVPLGEVRDRIIVGLSGPNESTINVPVFASVQGQLALQPSQLSFGVIEGKEVLVRSVKFENRGPQPVQVKEVRSNNPAVTASFKEVQPGKNYVIRVSVDPAKVSRDLRAALEVVTDNAQEPTLALNLFGILPPK